MNIISKAVDTFLNLMYPVSCMMCGEIIPYGTHEKSGWVCTECKKSLNGYLLENHELILDVSSDLYCVFSVFRYDGTVREAIFRMKFDCVKDYVKGMAELVHVYLKSDEFKSILGSDVVFVPVPLHKSRFRERGFNQAEILANSLSEHYNLPVVKALKRVKKTSNMFELSPEQRLANVKNAFLPTKVDISGKTVILVDDIYTTGATLNECSSALKKASAGRIYALTFSRVL